MKKKIQGYYFVTDSGLSIAGNESDVKAAAAAGAVVIQYRAKNICGKEMFEEASRLRLLCAGSIFVVNDRIDIAIACGADGVHVGQDDIPCQAARKLLGYDRIIGVTVHSVREAVKAQEDGADYIAVSPVFATATKKDAGKPAGIVLVSEVRKISKVPVVAIGGINISNAGSVIEAGADAVCAISCVVGHEEAGLQMKKIIEVINIHSNKAEK